MYFKDKKQSDQKYFSLVIKNSFIVSEVCMDNIPISEAIYVAN